MKFHHLARRVQSIAAAVVLAVGTFTGAAPAHATDSHQDALPRLSQTYPGTTQAASPWTGTSRATFHGPAARPATR